MTLNSLSKSSSFVNILYTKRGVGSFNLARDFIERMLTSQWLAKVPPCLKPRDCEFRMEAILIQTRLGAGTEAAEL